jgi:hypothetical protein
MDIPGISPMAPSAVDDTTPMAPNPAVNKKEIANKEQVNFLFQSGSELERPSMN